MLSEPVSMGDIRDAEGFVARTIHNSGRRLARDEFDELKAEGLVILCDLWARFEPHRPGYEKAGRFSGYAAAFLPRRLEDAYNRLHPEHRITRGQDGKREVSYGVAPVSLNGENAPDIGTQINLLGDENFATIDAAVRLLPIQQRLVASGVLCGMERGFSTDEIARLHRPPLDRGDVSRFRSAMASAITQVQRQEAA
jgi:hypothetical protein